MPLVELKGQFRFHAGDDPDGKLGYADASFNDSAWSLLASDQSWYSQGFKNYAGFGWYRFRVTVPAGQKNFALFVPDLNDVYALYANGQLIGQKGEFPPNSQLRDGQNLVYAIPPGAVPADRTIVFAARVWCSPLWSFSPGAGFDAAPIFGDSAAVARWADLQIHDRFWNTANVQFIDLVNITGAVLGLVLFLLRPSEREYLWYGIAQIFWSLSSSSWLAERFLHLPDMTAYFCYLIGMFGGAFVNLFFLHVLLRRRRGILFWIGSVFILFPVAWLFGTVPGWTSFRSLDGVIALSYFAYTLVTVLLISRDARSGNSEAWILFVPFTCAALFTLWHEAAYALNLLRFPAVAAIFHFLGNVFTWPIHADDAMIIGTACNLAVWLVLILRFARSRRDEERLSAELEAARAVQHVLIPDDIPVVPGFQIESVYKPAGQVGGDFFQIIPLERGGALIAIGDVSGKGMPAAMTVSLLVGTFRTLAHYTQSPAEILAAMNQRMLSRSQGGFTTCLVLRLDADSTLTVANAGHIAPYLGGSELDVANGLPLGLIPDADYTETTAHITSSDHLTLLTDGVVEARNQQGELLGFDRMRELTAQPASEIVRHAQHFGQEDDITVLTLSLTPQEVLV
jgi:Stage II sporulation protein E (SpoIIE)